MIDKVKIINDHLAFLYDLKDDIYMNINLNSNLEIPVQENEDELNRCLNNTILKIEALNQELSRVLLENE